LFNLLFKSSLLAATGFQMTAIQPAALENTEFFMKTFETTGNCVPLLVQITLDYTQAQIMLSCVCCSFHALNFSAKLKGGSEKFF